MGCGPAAGRSVMGAIQGASPLSELPGAVPALTPNPGVSMLKRSIYRRAGQAAADCFTLTPFNPLPFNGAVGRKQGWQGGFTCARLGKV